jgi:hypothetical protein
MATDETSALIVRDDEAASEKLDINDGGDIDDNESPKHDKRNQTIAESVFTKLIGLKIMVIVAIVVIGWVSIFNVAEYERKMLQSFQEVLPRWMFSSSSSREVDDDNKKDRHNRHSSSSSKIDFDNDRIETNGDGALIRSASRTNRGAFLGRDEDANEADNEDEAYERGIGVHNQIYGRKHMIDRAILSKREGKELPIFIHIPKTGGTSVEGMVANVGARIGSCNSREVNGGSNEAARPYEINQAWVAGGAEDFHSPPKASKLKNSFTTVRNPFTRAESEYFWYLLRKFPSEYEFVQNSTENWQTYVNNEGKAYYFNEILNRATFDEPKPSWMSCEKYGVWLKDTSNFVLKNSLLECYRHGQYKDEAIAACDDSLSKVNGGKGPSESDSSTTMIIGKAHSHHVPQYVLGKSAERVFSIEDCFGKDEGSCKDVRTDVSEDDPKKMQPNLISFLRENFSKRITYEQFNSISTNKELNKASLSQCWRNGNIPEETIENFLKAYDVDFAKYGYSKELPKSLSLAQPLVVEEEAKMGHNEAEGKKTTALSSSSSSLSWESSLKERFKEAEDLKSLSNARKSEIEKQVRQAKKQDEELEKLMQISAELADAKISAEIQLEETQKQILEERRQRAKRIVRLRRSNRKLLDDEFTKIEAVEEEFEHDQPQNRKGLFCAGGLSVPRVYVENEAEVGWATWNTDPELRKEMIERGEIDD